MHHLYCSDAIFVYHITLHTNQTGCQVLNFRITLQLLLASEGTPGSARLARRSLPSPFAADMADPLLGDDDVLDDDIEEEEEEEQGATRKIITQNTYYLRMIENYQFGWRG